MTHITRQIKFTTLVFALVFTNTALSAERSTNENKNNSSSNIIRNVNPAGYTDGDPAFTTDKNVNASSYDH
jgi:hypothetical protein